METAKAWFNAMEENVLSYQVGEKLPWTSIIDAMDWDTASLPFRLGSW
ncbi:hypothetical protein L4C34_15690 [Vibrio profundum]